jgi:methionyl aminopeptidase
MAMVEIKTAEQIAKMREAGLVVAAIHEATRAAAVPGASTKDLDDVARKVIADHGAKSNFLGYGGFPATICTSVNDIVVHGIPDRETVLKDGDLLSIDAGAIIDGWHGDAAFTVFVGEGHAPELHELSRVTEESMWAGIAAVRKGNRLIDISRAIEGYIRRQPRPASGKYGIIEDYGGHGIGSQMHMDPHLLNYGGHAKKDGAIEIEGTSVEPCRTRCSAWSWSQRSQGPRAHQRQDAAALHPHPARGPGGRGAVAVRPDPRAHRLPLQVDLTTRSEQRPHP